MFDAVIDDVHIRVCDKTYLHFSGNNYLGLSNRAEVKEGALEAIKNFGVNVSASRTTTGTSILHQRLESKLASFKGTEGAVCFASGFISNSVLLDVLSYDAVAIDGAAHPSIVWAIGNRYPVYRYNHCDPQSLESFLKGEKRRVLVMTDGVFPLTGEIAPLDHFAKLVDRFGIGVVVDDSHSTGVLGEHGRGTLDYFHIDSPQFYQTETMSKALGAYGGFISGGSGLTERIRSSSSIYAGSTALPPPCVGAAIAALDYITTHPEIRQRLFQNVRYLKDQIRSLGFNVDFTPVPIIPLGFSTTQKSNRAVELLKEQGIWARVINYPGGEGSPKIRITVSAAHTFSDIDQLKDALSRL